MRSLFLALTLLGSFGAFGFAADASVKKDQEGLQGVWSVVKAVRDGEVMPDAEREKMQVVIKGDEITIQTGQRDEKATFKLDPGKKPAGMDIRPKVDKAPIVLGIYQLDKDKLSLCFGREGKDRPKAFESAKNSGVGLLVLERKK
jgi:uncharacterized protein (TIGR03067 family)